MPRVSRSKSGVEIVHAMTRGSRKTPIFVSNSDREFFLRCLDSKCIEYGVTLLDYSLMGNHVHLLPRASGTALGKTLRDVLGSYSRYFNRKYDFQGHLFGNRFKSLPIPSTWWLLRTSRYIQMNPVVAGICRDPWAYRWSSAKAYGSPIVELRSLNCSIVLEEYGKGKVEAVQLRNYRGSMEAALKDARLKAGMIGKVRAAAQSHTMDEAEALLRLSRAKFLREIVDEAVRFFHPGGPNTEYWAKRLWVHTVQLQAPVPAWLLALPMVCEPSRVRQIAGEGARLYRDSSRFRTMSDYVVCRVQGLRQGLALGA